MKKNKLENYLDEKVNKSLNKRIKEYEELYEKKIPNDFHIIIRIDGHKFSKYSKGFIKPFDYLLSRAMQKTTEELMREFGAVTGYTQSDEITLLIPSFLDNTIDNRESEDHKLDKRVKSGWKHIYNGRVMKISSLVASYAAINFNYFLAEELELQDSFDPKYVKRILKKINKAWFDARVFGVPNETEVLNTFLFRTRDAEKNSKSVFAQTFIEHKKLQNLNGNEQISLCLKEVKKDWNTLPKRYKYGIFIKRTQIEKEIPKEFLKYHKNKKSVKRTVFESSFFKLKYNIKNVDFLMKKYK